MNFILVFLLLILALCPIQGEVSIWNKCGGIGHTGESKCDDSAICVVVNIWYSQCQPRPNEPNKVNEWGQCGGIAYNGKTLCQTWLTCVKLNDWYSNCQFLKPSTTRLNSSITITKSTSLSSSITPSSPSSSTTSKSLSVSSISSTSSYLLSQCNPTFQNKSLKIGISFDWTLNNQVNYNNFDYISIWLAYSDTYGTDFNPWFHGPMIDAALANNKLVVVYMYLIAFQARFNLKIEDCDVDPNYNLCTHGANFIRDNRQSLVDKYAYHAKWIAERYGREKRVVFAIEPDFVQYYSDQRQIGGTLSGLEMRQLFDDFVSAIKSELPNALISWDISPWLGQEGMRIWWGFFETAEIDFIHTSGGSLRPDLPQIRINELEWSFMSDLTKKYIISNCGYGVGGANINDCNTWINSNNLNNRINDGVIAITIASGNTIIPRVDFDCN